jgi:hypothetical protein
MMNGRSSSTGRSFLFPGTQESTQRRLFFVCHPEEASNASGRKDLGQLRVSKAGSGFEIAQRSLLLLLELRERLAA